MDPMKHHQPITLDLAPSPTPSYVCWIVLRLPTNSIYLIKLLRSLLLWKNVPVHAPSPGRCVAYRFSWPPPYMRTPSAPPLRLTLTAHLRFSSFFFSSICSALFFFFFFFSFSFSFSPFSSPHWPPPLLILLLLLLLLRLALLLLLLLDLFLLLLSFALLRL